MGYAVCIVLAEQVGESDLSLSYRLSPTDVAHCRELPVLVASTSMAAALMESSHLSDWQMKEEDWQVTQVLINHSEDGQLDIHSCMRNKSFWTKSLISPVRDKHSEETGTSGKRKEARCNNAPYQVCMCVTWVPEKGYKLQAFLALSTPNKPHC